RTAEVEDMNQAGMHPRTHQDLCNLLCQVVHVAVTLRRNRQLLLKDHAWLPFFGGVLLSPTYEKRRLSVSDASAKQVNRFRNRTARHISGAEQRAAAGG